MEQDAGWESYSDSSDTLPKLNERTTADKHTGEHSRHILITAGLATELYLDRVSVSEMDLSTESVRRNWRKLFLKKQYVCWEKNPWQNLPRVSYPPAAIRECRKIVLAMGKNEYESTSFVLSNLSDKPMEFAVTAKEAGISVTLRTAVWVTTHSGNEINDALPLLEGKLSVPAGESREIWLTLCSRGVRPGTYRPTILIKPQGMRSFSVDLNVKVYPVSLPDDRVSPKLLNEAQGALAESPKLVLADPSNPRLADAAKEKILKVLTRFAEEP